MNFSPYEIAAMLWPEKLGLEQAKDMMRWPVRKRERIEPPINRIPVGETWFISAGSFIKPGISITKILYPSGRLKWEVGRDYPIQPGWGQKQVGRFIIATIAWELDVTGISDKDIAREGYRNRASFLLAWQRLHGPHSGPPLGIWALGLADVDIDERKLPPAVWRVLEGHCD